MSRHALRNLVVFALLATLAAPSESAFGQFPGGGFRGGRRFNRGYPGMMPIPVPVQPAPAEPPKEEKKEDKKETPKVPEGPPPVTRPAAWRLFTTVYLSSG